ncbi:MAG: beta-class carbonic anhydrase [Phycisphaerae bacterium]
MSMVPDILAFNREFVASKAYEAFKTDKFPNKKLVVITCMDTRLVELLPRAMNMRNGDIKLIKSAGAVVAHPFGSIMRSVLVAVYELGAEEILVIGHHDCGMTGLESDRVLKKVRQRGISDDVIETLRNAGIDLESWLKGFSRVEDAVLKSVNLIRKHPLLPKEIVVHGLMIHPETGKLETVE